MTKTEWEIGTVMPEGDTRAGCTYAGADENGPLWVSPFAPKRLNHDAAADWAKARGGGLPTMKEGKYLDSVKGGLGKLFNLSGSFPDGYVWLAEPLAIARNYFWC